MASQARPMNIFTSTKGGRFVDCIFYKFLVKFETHLQRRREMTNNLV